MPVDLSRQLEQLLEGGAVVEATAAQVGRGDKEFADVESVAGPTVFTNGLVAATLNNIEHGALVSASVRRASLRQLAKQMPVVPPYTDIEACVHKALSLLRELFESNPSSEEITRYKVGALHTSAVHLTRVAAQSMRMTSMDRFTPLLPPNFALFTAGRDEGVAQIVVERLPMPDDSVSVEEILRFREDDDARRSFRRLHAWMAEAARGGRSRHELAEELELLIDKYTEYMRIHKMKAQTGYLETFFTAAADVLTGLAHLDLASATRSLFALRMRKIGLLEAEMAAPGREVAYVVSAQARFERGD
ncbi:MAG: hypothetical protein QOK37_3385 [Thermoanaerobaculia bacterium]|nr:hypothetical protein [Thermoanaerobaculia bacterium]